MSLSHLFGDTTNRLNIYSHLEQEKLAPIKLVDVHPLSPFIFVPTPTQKKETKYFLLQSFSPHQRFNYIPLLRGILSNTLRRVLCL